MTTDAPVPPPKPHNVLEDIAKRNGRDYITPEDVDKATRSFPRSVVQWHLLAAIGKRHSVGVEDYSLCCFVASGPPTSPPPPRLK
jgi:hypothetical protein